MTVIEINILKSFHNKEENLMDNKKKRFGH